MKTESKCGRRGLKGWLICVSDLPVLGMFSSTPTVATFPIRSRMKFPELLNPKRNQSVISGFPLGGFRLTAPWLGNRIRFLSHFQCFLLGFFTSFLITLMPSKFPCLGQKKLKYNATYPCSNGFLPSIIKLRSHKVLCPGQSKGWICSFQVQRREG